MIRKNITFLLIAAGLILALFSIPNSGALTAAHMVRSTKAIVVSDSNAMLKLTNFSGNAGKGVVNGKRNYMPVNAFITNNTSLTIDLTVTISPTFKGGNELGIKIGSVTLVNTDKKNINHVTPVITMAPGEVIPIYAYLTADPKQPISTTFSFTAKESGTSKVLYHVAHTTNSPRVLNFDK